MAKHRGVTLITCSIAIALIAAWAGRATAPTAPPRSEAGKVEVRDKISAQLAATRVVALLGDPATLRGGRRSALGALTAPGASATINARLTVPAPIEQATGLLEDLNSGRPVVAYVVPVATEVTRYSSEAATVDVWTVSVLGTQRLGTTTSSWSTETVSLAWSGKWKASDVRSRPGPTPAAHSAAATPILQILHDTAAMNRYDGAGR
jgi:hypothetical protein